jgi:hypothetical protein
MTLKYSSPSTAIKNYNDSKLAKRETNDCVVRAIAAASGWEYDKAHKFVADEFKRENRRGTRFFNSTMVKLANNDCRLNRKKITTISKGVMKNGKSRMTIGSFVKQYDKGTYILTVRGHAFSIKDGEVIGGNRQDATKMRCILEGAWKVGLK